MSKREKRLARIRQNPKNVSVDDLRVVLEDYGFEYKQTIGSHLTFAYMLEGKTKLFVLPFRRPIKPIYVRRAIEIIDQIIQERGDDDSES